MEKETVELAGASTSAIRDFTRVIADDSPRFSFFIFKREPSRNAMTSQSSLMTCDRHVRGS